MPIAFFGPHSGNQDVSLQPTWLVVGGHCELGIDKSSLTCKKRSADESMTATIVPQPSGPVSMEGFARSFVNHSDAPFIFHCHALFEDQDQNTDNPTPHNRSFTCGSQLLSSGERPLLSDALANFNTFNYNSKDRNDSELVIVKRNGTTQGFDPATGTCILDGSGSKLKCSDMSGVRARYLDTGYGDVSVRINQETFSVQCVTEGGEPGKLMRSDGGWICGAA